MVCTAESARWCRLVSRRRRRRAPDSRASQRERDARHDGRRAHRLARAAAVRPRRRERSAERRRQILEGRSVTAAAAASSEFATALLLALVERGVEHVVVSPGSRSQALALAAAELEAAGLLHLHVRIDERDAAFLALGIGMATRRPAAVITTSGSAVGNLVPAAMEAARAQVPMLLLTADRPAELRGTGANQTTRQANILGDLATLDHDLAEEDYARDPVGLAVRLACEVLPFAEFNRPGIDDEHVSLRGPMQVNVQFVEPLSGRHTETSALQALVRRRIDDERPQHPLLNATRKEAATVPARGTVLVAGLGADVDLVRAARDAGVPVIAEITSGARQWHTVKGYREWLDHGADGACRMIVTGLPSLSRQVWHFAERADVQVIAVAPAGREHFSPGHRARRVDLLRFEASAQGGDAHGDGAADAPGASVVADEPLTGEALTREAVIDAVWRHSRIDAPSADAIYLASSHMVRVADERVGASAVPVFGHRGLAGIDGTISAASGVADARRAAGAGALTRLVIGDLAFAHDVGGLLRPECEAAPPLQIIVVNDHGGSIFAGLEVATADPALYERVVRTPQPLRVRETAAAYGWAYRQARDVAELDGLVAAGEPGIVEVVIDA
ncbi:2-succinyl-5-enolpyruvyl-6-hydroxy-3-cyclohexene-1-carboxylic-acid synthase [Pseudoclavibacter sp. CFCC 13796]|nr:2-succinyl-5-enolpyruvyl-6-hydroxy-3-cyclohexene-1-carboxylic-acid synthase [Pseudoclavibacter sp. CFCC 13796]